MKKCFGAAALLVATAALSACGAKKDPNALTDEDNRQLANAAEMLDASPDSLTANEDAAPGNGDEGNAQDNVGEDAGNAASNGQ